MGGFVRMQAFRKTMGDDEFVEYVRGDLARRPRRRAIMLAVGFGLILLGIVWLPVVPNLLHAKLAAQEADVLWQAIIAGVAAGAAGAVFVLMGVRLLAEAAGGAQRDRMAKMLLDSYHSKAAPEDATSPRNGPAPITGQ